MTHRNRCFTEVKNGDGFHGELLNNQMVTRLTVGFIIMVIVKWVWINTY